MVIWSRFVRFSVKLFERAPRVIVCIDGGLTSQMFQYALGYKIKEMGYEVEYDITWFKNVGSDIKGEEKRFYRLGECFPHLVMNVADEKSVKRYKKYYHDECPYEKGEIKRIKKPLYLYYQLNDEYSEVLEEYKTLFRWNRLYSLLSEKCRRLADDIVKKNKHGYNTIGVHVRRGDMALVGYDWPVLTEHYFLEVIEMIQTDKCSVYFFSNGFDFVEDNIIPMLNKSIDIHLVKGNKDYEDAYLYSLCQAMIGSQSGWGVELFRFNENENKTLYTPDNGKRHTYPNIHYIQLNDQMVLK